MSSSAHSRSSAMAHKSNQAHQVSPANSPAAWRPDWNADADVQYICNSHTGTGDQFNGVWIKSQPTRPIPGIQKILYDSNIKSGRGDQINQPNNSYPASDTPTTSLHVKSIYHENKHLGDGRQLNVALYGKGGEMLEAGGGQASWNGYGAPN